MSQCWDGRDNVVILCSGCNSCYKGSGWAWHWGNPNCSTRGGWHSIPVAHPVLVGGYILNPFQTNFSANCILLSSYLFWAGKTLVDYL